MKTVLVEDQERPLVWVEGEDGWLAPIGAHATQAVQKAAPASPYDDSPDLAERFEADRAARYVRLVGLFLALCCWAGAELATAFAFREFALAPLIAAACFAIVSRRVWAALA